MAEYEALINVTAKRELQSLPDRLEEQLHETILEVCETESPTEHPKVTHLTGTPGMFRIRVGDARAICKLDKPRVWIWRIGLRERVYSDIDDLSKQVA